MNILVSTAKCVGLFGNQQHSTIHKSAPNWSSMRSNLIVCSTLTPLPCKLVDVGILRTSMLITMHSLLPYTTNNQSLLG